jgi:NTP pyrophosphatase (non-canonical NTP hydrolase)
MTSTAYQQHVKSLAADGNVFCDVPTDLLHCGLGLATEAGEFLDAVKKTIFYCKDFDRINAKEELGDVLWYVALGASALGLTLDDLMESNIAKLKIRYPEEFAAQLALNRDLEAERRSLETGVPGGWV